MNIKDIQLSATAMHVLREQAKIKKQKEKDLLPPKRTRRRTNKLVTQTLKMPIVKDRHNKHGKENRNSFYRTIRSVSGSHFYNPLEAIDQSIRDRLTHELNSGIVLKSVITEQKQVSCKLEGLERKRFFVSKKAKLYVGRNSFLSSISKQSKRKPLTERQCDAAIKAIKELEDHDNLLNGEE
jgi:hypothetical protein